MRYETRQRKRRGVLVATSGSALLFLLLVWLTAPAPAAFPSEGDNGRLAFVRDGDVYTANADGSGTVNTRDTASESFAPAWHPYGSKIVFCSSPGIYTINSDGSDLHFVTSATCEFYDGPSWSNDGTKILFSSDCGSGTDDEICVVDPDGTGLANLTDNDAYDSTPVWSPDGSKIAFASGAASFDQDIYTMNPDGTGQTLVTDGIGSNEEPNWSPDGGRIAFASDRDCIGCDTSSIYSIDQDGTDLARLTTSPTLDKSPAYSPDGTMIAFESCDPLDCAQAARTVHVMNADGTNPAPVMQGINPDWGVPSPPFAPPPADGKIAYASPQDFVIGNRDEIYTMYADGFRQTRLTVNDVGDNDPAWSWDRSTLAYTSRADGDDYEIYRIPSVGRFPGVNLTSDPAQDVQPTFSPFSDQIAFASDRGAGSTTGIYVMGNDGSNPTELTDPPEEVSHRTPAWSPDGGKIAFVSNEDGDDDIYLMNPDGSGVENVSNTAGVDEASPAWSPGGQQIAYIRVDEGDQQVWTMSRSGAGQSQLTTGSLYATSPTWSPTGTKIAFAAAGEIYAINTDATGLTNLTTTPLWAESDPAWEPPDTSQPFVGYARPKAATPITVRLVPAFKSCSEPNAEHGAPLTSAACSPPVPESDYLTIGAPPANAASSTGTLALKVFCNDGAVLPCPASGDQEDVQMTASITDVRNKADGSDYTGELRATLTIRITDRYNTPGLTRAGTVMDASLGFPLACTATAGGDLGSTCSASTTADSILPGIAREIKRAIWQLGAIEVYDGGEDGDADTAGDNTLFAVQGLFTP